jgi:hypothetical protein
MLDYTGSIFFNQVDRDDLAAERFRQHDCGIRLRGELADHTLELPSRFAVTPGFRGLENRRPEQETHRPRGFFQIALGDQRLRQIKGRGAFYPESIGNFREREAATRAGYQIEYGNPPFERLDEIAM